MDAKGIKELIVLNGRDAELYEGSGIGERGLVTLNLEP
jgi:hypothetical protein